jgi:hypothetical protein
MTPSKKSIIQNPEGRGFMNGNQMKLGNHFGEITYNVALGVNSFFQYTMLGQLKFASLEDAQDYIFNTVGATEGTLKGKEYYSLSKQEGCAFSAIGFYSVKTN